MGIHDHGRGQFAPVETPADFVFLVEQNGVVDAARLHGAGDFFANALQGSGGGFVVIEKDYGCGDPSSYLKPGETVRTKWKPVLGVLASWLITLPCAAALAAVVLWLAGWKQQPTD